MIQTGNIHYSMIQTYKQSSSVLRWSSMTAARWMNVLNTRERQTYKRSRRKGHARKDTQEADIPATPTRKGRREHYRWGIANSAIARCTCLSCGIWCNARVKHSSRSCRTVSLYIEVQRIRLTNQAACLKYMGTWLIEKQIMYCNGFSPVRWWTSSCLQASESDLNS